MKDFSMKVLYDNFIFQHQTIGGISRYCYELMNYYFKNKILDFSFPIYYSLNQYIKNSEFTPKMNFYMNSFLCKIGEFRKYLRKKNTISVIKALKSEKYDVFHPSYFNAYFLEALNKSKKTKFVITIHDMVTEAYPDTFKGDNLEIAKIKKELAYRADKIITISEFSKREILKYYTEISEEKISVIYHGNSLEGIELPEKNNNVDNYILYVGARKGYKNFQFMLKSIASLIKEKNLKLYCASSWDFDEEEQKLLKELGVEESIKNIKATDNELFELYRNAVCCVFPSLYEGFGLPILEAFALNCPIICSNCASLPEIGQKGCEYFDATSEKSIYDKVKEVVENEELRLSMVSRGKERLKDFSWTKTAENTKKVYEEMILNV